MTYQDYAYAVAVAVHEQTGWPLHEAENIIGDVSDMMGKYSAADAAAELLESHDRSEHQMQVSDALALVGKKLISAAEMRIQVRTAISLIRSASKTSTGNTRETLDAIVVLLEEAATAYDAV